MFDPRIRAEEQVDGKEAIKWCSENVQWAVDAIENGETLKKGANPFFDNNPRLRKGDIVFEYSDEELDEIIRCSEDVLYWVAKYGKLRTTTDDGTEIRNIVPYDYQTKQLIEFQNAVLEKDYDRFIMLWSRQASKTTTTSLFMCWLLCFQIDFQIAILANKKDTSKEVLDKVKAVYLELPFFMQAGVYYYNTSTMALDNDNKVSCYPTVKDALNGRSINFLYIDEFAFTFDGDSEQQLEFLSQAMPVLSATRGIMAISSTPNGKDLFCEMYDKSLRGENTFRASTVPWYMIPGKTATWAQRQIDDIGKPKFLVQYELQFDVETNRILNAKTMKVLTTNAIKFENGAYDITPFDDKYFRFNQNVDINFEKDFYIFTIDIAEGLGLDGDSDYSTIHGLKLCHTMKNGIAEISLQDNIIYECNTITVGQLAYLVAELSHGFAQDQLRLLVEYNTYGELLLKYIDSIDDEDLEVESEVWMKFKRNMDAKTKIRGLRTNTAIKRIGVSAFKKTFENGGIECFDERTIEQIKFFNKAKNGTYKASSGHDDLVTPLVNLAFGISLNDVTWKEFIEDYLEANNVDYDDWRFIVDLNDVKNQYREE